jgi:N-acetylmuramoyl-L-alanine amidase
MANELIGLDIGHGENTFDSGSKGVRVNGVGYEEHHFNSRVAMKTKKLLEHNSFRTIMAQQPFQNEVSLSKRIAEYNKHNIVLGFSIHANASSPTAKGLCAFYWNTSPEGKKAAEIYARLIGGYGYPKYSGGLEPSKLNHWTEFAMLRDTKGVWLLTENGFMTNPEDFQNIFKNPTYEDHLAEIHCKIACEYVGRAFKPLSLATAPSKPNAPVAPQPTNTMSVIGVATVLVDVLNVREHADFNSRVVGVVKKGEGYKVFAKTNGLYNVGGSQWISAGTEYTKFVPSGNTAPQAPSATPKKRYVILPASADTWRVYPVNKAPVKANTKGYLKPSKFKGLEYEIIGNPQADVYTIKTGDFGTVNIYAAPSTGAKIVTK